MPINNVSRTPVQRTMGSSESIASRAIDRAFTTIDRVIPLDRVESIVTRTLNALAAPIINKIETFSESHPRLIQTLEPVICSLIRFAYNNPVLAILLAEIPFCGMLILLATPTHLLLEYLALSKITTALLIFPMIIPTVVFVVTIVALSIMIPEKLVEKHLEQAVDINKLTEAFLNLAPEFVATLNEWTRNESQEVDSQWIDARKTIIDFYNSTYKTTLSLEHFNLHSLPNVFDNPKFRNKIKNLFLYNNHLARVPESIGNLQSLISLNLADNPELTGLPSTILQLPPTCTVDITNCNFSQTVLARIREITREPGYAGPRISHSMREQNSFFQSARAPSIEQSLRKLYRISGRNYHELPELNRIPNLRSWLHKLTWVSDFRDGSQQAFVTKIIEYLERANEDNEFREVLEATILDATETCGDRVALSVLNLGVAHKLSTLDLANMHELYHLLTRGVLALDLLQDIARQKIPTLRMFDEIEVYLGYPVKLKEALNLPIDIESMLYFECSALSLQDLEDAKNSVSRSLSNEDMQIAFLKTQPKWIDALNMNYSEEMQKIAEAPDIAEEGLINLTRKIIQSFNS